MSADRLPTLLERRSPGAWEIYRKTAETRTLETASGPRGGAPRRESVRREEGWAARWWERGLRFASASDAERLAIAVERTSELPAREETAPRLPAHESLRAVSPAPVEPPPSLFERLAPLVSERSRGDAVLASLAIRRGRTVEEIENAAGLSARMETPRLDGIARALGRRGSIAREARAVFRWDAEPDVEGLASRLADAATFPLAAKGPTFPRGSLLLDPSVAAALLAAIAPLFTTDVLPLWVRRGQIASRKVSIFDDASVDAPFDGEGTTTRRVAIVEEGALSSRLHDLRSAARSGRPPTGHGVRPSYRMPPEAAPRRLFMEDRRAVPPRELLSSVARGIFARAVTAPLAVDLERDRVEIEFTGVAVLGGRATEPVAGAKVSGRLSELLERIAGLATDRQFFPMPYPVGASTVLVEKVGFE